jgi:hypothetical protein
MTLILTMCIELFKEFGNKYIISEGNGKELKEGAMRVKVRYYYRAFINYKHLKSL